MKPAHLSLCCGIFLLGAMLMGAGPSNRSPVDFVQLTELKVNATPPAIHAATAKNQVGELKRLVADGIAPDAADPSNNWRPIHYAAFHNAIGAAELLADSKASLNIGVGPELLTAMHIAAIRDNPEMIQFLYAKVCQSISEAPTAIRHCILRCF